MNLLTKLKQTITEKKLFLISTLLGLTIISSFYTINTIAGSSRFIFTGINCLLMLAGSFFGITAGTASIVLFFVIKSFWFSFPFTAGIPTLASTTCFGAFHKNNTAVMRSLAIGVPLLCIILFCIHPIGSLAMTYSTYWIIPVICYALSNAAPIFCAALASTFIAHAIGSIMWLYLQPTTAAYWLNLIPVVAAERLIFASAATLMYYGIVKSYNLLKTKNYHARLICK